MNLKLEFAERKITGTASNCSWAQSFVFNNLGTLFGVVSLKSLSEKEASLLGKEILDFLEEKSHLLSDKNILIDLQSFVHDLLNTKSDYEIELSLAYLWQNYLYFIAVSGGQIVLKREKSFSPFFQDNPETVKSASGLVKENDCVVLQTSQFNQIVDYFKLAEIMENKSLDEIFDLLAPQIHNASENDRSAALIIVFGKEVIIDEEEKEKEIETERPIIFQKEPIPLDNINQTETPHSKKVLFTIALILIVILVVVVFLNLTQKNNQTQKIKIETTLKSVNLRLEEAKSLVDLNPVRAKTIFSDSKSQITLLKKEVKKGSNDEKAINNLISQIDNYLKLTTRAYQVNPVLHYDLTLLKDKATGTSLSFFGNNLLIFDNKNNSLYLIDIVKKSGGIIAGGKDLTGTSKISLYGDNSYLLNPEKGIVRVNNKSQKKELLLSKDGKWQKVTNLLSFSGNLYLLDLSGQIWKYIATENGFSDIKNYLTEDTKPDFSHVSGFTIDGSIYILNNDGEILKYTQGRIDGFSLSGLDLPFGPGSQITTNDELQNLYILDSKNNRVVVVDKTGKYEAQYQSDLIGKTTGIVISEDLKKLYLLLGKDIFVVDLK